MTRWFAGAVVVAALIGPRALAHEGGTHVRGVVKEATTERIVLTTPEGEALTIALAPGTRITRGKAAVPAGDIHAGERAIVHAKPSAGQLEATEVKLAEAPKKN